MTLSVINPNVDVVMDPRSLCRWQHRHCIITIYYYNKLSVRSDDLACHSLTQMVIAVPMQCPTIISRTTSSLTIVKDSCRASDRSQCHRPTRSAYRLISHNRVSVTCYTRLERVTLAGRRETRESRCQLLR